MSRRGLALILVVGVLGVLAVLGSAFVVLSRMERKAAQLRVLGTQALLLARSGLEDAQARLDAGQDPEYGGEDWNADGVLNAGPETDSQVHRPASLDVEGCPVRHAMAPSFFRAGAGGPKLVTVEGRPRGYTGSFGDERMHWAVRVVPAGGFHVNGGDPSVVSDPTAVSDYNTQLRRMFGILGEAIDREDGTGDSDPVGRTDGENLIALRPPTGWQSLEQIRAVALGGSRAKLEALGSYLLLQSAVDLKVIQPNVLEEYTDTEYTHQADLRQGSYFDGTDAWAVKTRKAPVLESLGTRGVGRAPMNLDWARTRRPALIALLGNLRGLYFCDVNWNSFGDWDGPVGTLRPVGIGLDWSMPSDDCRVVAQALMGTTSELRTWEQFDAFCDGLPLTGVSDLGQAKKDLLKSNFNPNSRLMKFNPPASLGRVMDKSDLLDYSTEFELSPTSGSYRIASVGRVGALVQRILSCDRSADRVLRLTTQREFVAGDLGRLELAGDEVAPRAFGTSPYITPSAGAGRTFGHKLTGNLGSSLQTYPDPHTVWAPPSTFPPASYDGQIRQATVETRDADAPAGGTMMFLARYDDHHNADYGGGVLTYTGDSMLGVVSRSSPSLRTSVWPKGSAAPNTLYPDGTYSEGFALWGTSSPGYQAPGNLPPYHGTISYWFRPFCDAEKFGEAYANTSRVHFNNYRSQAAIGITVPFKLSTLVYPDALTPGSAMESGLSLAWDSHWNVDLGSQDRGIRRLLRSRWHLATCFWDTCTSTYDLSTRVLIDRGTGAMERNSPWSYAQALGTPLGTPPLVDFTLQEGSAGSFCIGTRTTDGGSAGSYGPDATIDEFAIYDLGTSAADGTLHSEQLALARYKDGRYYKEDDGAWFSAPVDLGGARVRVLSWTQVVPRGLRAPAVEVPEDGDAGPDGRIVFDLTDASGSSRLADRYYQDPRGERIGRRLPPFRFHAVFQPNLDPETKLDKAILDPLTLDDITLTYRPLEQPALCAWSEGE